MITRVQYLRLSTLLPIVTPAVVVPLVHVADLSGWPAPSWLRFVAAVSFPAALIFGIPYLFLIGVLLLVMWRRSWKAHLAALLLAPLLMSGVLALVVSMLDASPKWTSEWWYASWCLGVGYSYVAIALAGLSALGRAGRLRPDPEAVRA